MYYQNLQKQIGEIHKSRLKIGLGIIFGIILLSLIFYFNYRLPLNHKQIDNLIDQSEPLKKIDNLCQNLPKPKKFYFIKKNISGNSRIISVSYFYQSELENNEIKNFFSEWFLNNNWTLEYQKTLDFRKGDLIVRIDKGYREGVDYVIYCAEEL